MPPTFSIFLGDHKTLFLKAKNDSCSGGGPLDLTDCTEIDIALPNQDGTLKHLLLSLTEVVITTPAVLGKYSAVITSLVSAALNVGQFQAFDVTFTIAANKFTVRYERALSVFELR